MQKQAVLEIVEMQNGGKLVNGSSKNNLAGNEGYKRETLRLNNGGEWGEEGGVCQERGT